MEAVGAQVTRLIRISYGPFRLNELQPGEVEELKPRVLREQLGLATAEETPKPTRKLAPRPGKAGPRPSADPGEERAKPKGRPLKPGAGLQKLSETWQKATRAPTGKAERPATARPGRPATTTSHPGPRPGPRPRPGPKKG
jgi:23S rRNA pseudouridine2605 synthase